MATLLVVAGPSDGQCFPLKEHRLVAVGRDDQCTFQILDEEISRRHLQIRFDQDDSRHYAVDMRSANGVYVNGNRLTQDVALVEGDIIQIGRTQIRYLRDDFPDAEPHEKETGSRGVGLNGNHLACLISKGHNRDRIRTTFFVDQRWHGHFTARLVPAEDV